MEITLIILVVILSLLGLVGSVLPALPGPPLNYLAILLLQWAYHPFSVSTLLWLGGLMIAVLLLDYYLPVITAKRYGATREGVIGSIIGMVLGMFFTPVGMVAGTLTGAVIGDLIAGRSGRQAAVSGIAVLAGTVLSIGIKLMASGLMTSLVIYKLIARLGMAT
ncbi:MAG: DUF456 domain-containing protein [Bacteroidetes bacterium]|nr:DUF456 domain-containing protein [Bacteroidota bacterium]